MALSETSRPSLQEGRPGQIQNQLEYWFSDENLSHDRYLRAKIAQNSEGCKFTLTT